MGAKASLLILLLLSILLGIARTDFAPVRPQGHKPKTQITFWNGFTGPDGRVMLEIVRQFNAANPDVEVTMQRIAWATYYNKVMVSALDRRGPEVFVMQSFWLPRMVHAGFVDPLDDIYSDKAFLDDFDPRLIERTMFTDEQGVTHRMGVPLDIWPQGLYVNGRVMKELGLVNDDGSPRGPKNRDEFFMVLRKFKDEKNGQWGFGFGDWFYNFMSIAPQFGGRFLDENGNPTLDDPNNARALQFMGDLINKDKLVAPVESGVGGWVGFRQQKVAMALDGVYMLGDLKLLTDHPYVGAQLPVLGDRPGTMVDSHILCIRKGVTPEQREAGERFIRYLSDHGLQWADAGQVPARISVRNDPKFKELKVQYAFAQELPYGYFPPKTPSLRELQLAIGAAVERVLRGNMTATESLKIAQQDYSRYLEREKMERQFSEKK